MYSRIFVDSIQRYIELKRETHIFSRKQERRGENERGSFVWSGIISEIIVGPATPLGDIVVSGGGIAIESEASFIQRLGRGYSTLLSTVICRLIRQYDLCKWKASGWRAAAITQASTAAKSLRKYSSRRATPCTAAFHRKSGRNSIFSSVLG